MCYCFRAPIKTFFFDTCQMTVKSCDLHLFPVPQTGRSHIINILLASFFSVHTVNYGPSFFPSIYGPRSSHLGHKSMEKNLVRNLQYGPKTPLIRGICSATGKPVHLLGDVNVNILRSQTYNYAQQFLKSFTKLRPLSNY